MNFKNLERLFERKECKEEFQNEEMVGTSSSSPVNEVVVDRVLMYPDVSHAEKHRPRPRDCSRCEFLLDKGFSSRKHCLYCNQKMPLLGLHCETCAHNRCIRCNKSDCIGDCKFHFGQSGIIVNLTPDEIRDIELGVKATGVNWKCKDKPLALQSILSDTVVSHDPWSSFPLTAKVHVVMILSQRSTLSRFHWSLVMEHYWKQYCSVRAASTVLQNVQGAVDAATAWLATVNEVTQRLGNGFVTRAKAAANRLWESFLAAVKNALIVVKDALISRVTDTISQALSDFYTENIEKWKPEIIALVSMICRWFMGFRPYEMVMDLVIELGRISQDPKMFTMIFEFLSRQREADAAPPVVEDHAEEEVVVGQDGPEVVGAGLPQEGEEQSATSALLMCYHHY
jgi:hypothetical protein